MKTKIVIAVVIAVIIASWCTTTDEAVADVLAHDAEYTRLTNEVGENAAHFLMENRKYGYRL